MIVRKNLQSLRSQDTLSMERQTLVIFNKSRSHKSCFLLLEQHFWNVSSSTWLSSSFFNVLRSFKRKKAKSMKIQTKKLTPTNVGHKKRQKVKLILALLQKVLYDLRDEFFSSSFIWLTSQIIFSSFEAGFSSHQCPTLETKENADKSATNY